MTMKTVLITGCSSGYGLETARHFLAKGWNVIATMRTPREDVLPRSERLRVLALDVTRPDSIAAALAACGPIDVLVNNAGIGVVGAFEATPMTTVREVFETNTFGVMAMTQAVLPNSARVGSGVVVNVTSSATLARMPLRRVHRKARWPSKGSPGRSRSSSSSSTCARSCRAGLRPDHRASRATAGARMEGLIPEGTCLLRSPSSQPFAKPAAVTTESDVAEAVCVL